ncbi:MAG: UDP-N-acetylmuramate--L-alanine ligase [Kiritimatiellae bacterium]|nr:UDP-N-acetylmuramate--L-alanine ligase [Kiritimatiellia bacterium]
MSAATPIETALARLEAGGRVHLMGIGGVGVAGLAHLLAAQGFSVSGCDPAATRLPRALAAAGISVAAGHAPAHLQPPPDWLIRSAAVPPHHPEIAEAHRLGIPVSRRGEALAALTYRARGLAVAGTHGKTTTTAMLVQIFHAAGVAPSFAIGGEVEALGGVAGGGQSDWLIVEADESDGTLAFYSPAIAVVTNVDLDHLEHFRDLAEFRGVFERFVRQTREVACLCADDPGAAALAAIAPRRVLYGLDDRADVRAGHRKAGGGRQRAGISIGGRFEGELELPVPGVHNLRNALGAIAAATAAGVPPATSLMALARFRPARRRMDVRVERPDLLVVSDYAHHPAEIRALLEAVRETWPARPLLVAFQPHRYTRTLALRNEFPPAFRAVERLWLAPVYAASEPVLAGGTAEDLQAEFFRQGRTDVRLANSLDDLWAALERERRPGDLVLFVGAGDIEELADRAAREWGGEMAR